MNAAVIKELLSERSKAERAKKAVDAREIKAGRKQPILSDACADKITEPKRDTRKEGTDDTRLRRYRKTALFASGSHANGLAGARGRTAVKSRFCAPKLPWALPCRLGAGEPAEGDPGDVPGMHGL
jgi:hypothetical protein